MTPDEYCQKKSMQSGSSFYYSFLFLPQQQRKAITAVYAFCREVDDVVDECTDLQTAQTTLDWWKKEIAALFSGTPSHPITLALEPLIHTFQLEQPYFLAMIEGMEMDLHHNRYEQYADLSHYCWHVASSVGILAARIFGGSDTNTRPYAEKLGLAFQLTNIIRDVGEDARRQRIYLPQAELEQFKVKEADILHGHYTENFKQLMRFQHARAISTYKEALALLASTDERPQKTGLMMASIYHTLLQEIAHSEFQVLHQRIALTPLRKLWLAWRTHISQGSYARKLIENAHAT